MKKPRAKAKARKRSAFPVLFFNGEPLFTETKAREPASARIVALRYVNEFCNRPGYGHLRVHLRKLIIRAILADRRSRGRKK